MGVVHWIRFVDSDVQQPTTPHYQDPQTHLWVLLVVPKAVVDDEGHVPLLLPGEEVEEHDGEPPRAGLGDGACGLVGFVAMLIDCQCASWVYGRG